MSIRNLGIHITQEAVYLVVVESAFLGRVRVLDSLRVEIPNVQGLSGAAELPVDPSVTEALRSAMGHINLEKVSNISLVLPNEEVIVRYFNMPKLAKEEQFSAAAFEARRYLPFKIEDLIFDSASFENRGNPKEVQVNFVAIKKERLAHYLASLEAVGAKPRFIEPTCISLMRLLAISKKIQKGSHIILVEVGARGFDITILNSQLILLSRGVSLPHADGAQAGLQERLTSEILNTCEYHKNQFPSTQIAKVILAGGGFPAESIKALHQDIGLDVVGIQDMHMPYSKMGLSSESFPALGAALRGIKNVICQVNIAVEKVLPPTVGKRILKEVTAEAVLAFIFLTLLYLLFAKQDNLLQEKLRKAIAMRPQVTVPLDMDKSSHDELRAFKRDLESRFKTTVLSLMESPHLTPKLSRIGAALPSKDIWLTTLEFNCPISQTGTAKRNLRVTGRAISSEGVRDMDLISQFVSNLRNDKDLLSGFEKVDLASVQKELSPEGDETTLFNLLLE